MIIQHLTSILRGSKLVKSSCFIPISGIQVAEGQGLEASKSIVLQVYWLRRFRLARKDPARALSFEQGRSMTIGQDGISLDKACMYTVQ